MTIWDRLVIAVGLLMALVLLALGDDEDARRDAAE